MSVQFLLEPAALDANNLDEPTVNANHERIIDIWLQYGVLALPSKSDDLLQKIGTLPTGRRKLWETALQSEWFRRVDVELESLLPHLEKEETLLDLRRFAELACLEATRAACISTGDGEYSKYYAEYGFEVCRFDCIDRAQTVIAQRKLWNTPIFVGETRETIWAHRFSGLTRHARRISIIDRYAGVNLVDEFDRGQVCGLASYLRLLNQLKGAQKKKTINVFVSDHDLDAAKLEDYLRRIAATYRTHLASVHLHITPDPVFSTVAHDRFIRFDALITSIGKGVGLFREPQCTANFSCSLILDDDQSFRQRIEAKLSANSTHVVIL